MIEALYEVLDAHTRISLRSSGVSINLKSNHKKFDTPPWSFVLKYLRKEQNLSMVLTEFLSENAHLVGFRWRLPSVHGKEHLVMFRMTTVEDPNQSTDDRITFRIKIPRINFTLSQSNINDMIQDFNDRIGIQFGTPKIIEEPDKENPEMVFFSPAWTIKYDNTKVFDPTARMFLETKADSISFSVMKCELGDKFDVRFSVPQFAMIAGINESERPPAPQHRKLEITMLFPSTGEKKDRILSGCKKGARTFHDITESSKFTALGLTFVEKSSCPLCNFPVDPTTLNVLFHRICPVPGCAHSYGNRREDEKHYLDNFDSHDCERELHAQGHMKNYEKPVLPTINISVKPTPEEMSRNVIESTDFAAWKVHIDRQAQQHEASKQFRTNKSNTEVLKPVYTSPSKVKSTPRQGFKRAKRA